MSNVNEKTFVLIKCDGVARGLVGEILSRFERKGLSIEHIDRQRVSKEHAMGHYAEHKDKPYFHPLVESISCGPVIAMCLSGLNVVKVVRTMIGSTAGYEAAPGTIRGDFSNSQRFNLIHASDSVESAERELKYWFPDHKFWPTNSGKILIYTPEERDFLSNIY